MSSTRIMTKTTSGNPCRNGISHFYPISIQRYSTTIRSSSINQFISWTSLTIALYINPQIWNYFSQSLNTQNFWHTTKVDKRVLRFSEFSLWSEDRNQTHLEELTLSSNMIRITGVPYSLLVPGCWVLEAFLTCVW